MMGLVTVNITSTTGALASDAELVQAIRRGWMEEFGVLYERHVAAAYRVARQLAQSRMESDDLVSEAFVRVLDILRAGRGPDVAFRAYLFTVLRNLACDGARHERRIELAEDVTTVAGVKTENVSEPARDTALEAEEFRCARLAFGRLPQRWQEVLRRTEMEGRSPAETASLLGLTANGVSALALRARRRLREAYLVAHLPVPDTEQCRCVHVKLGAWTRGTLSACQARQIREHLDGCGYCLQQADEMAAINAAQLRRAAA